MIKLVAIDMDGTLLNSKKEVPADFNSWVKKHRDIKTVIASGRQYITLKKDFIALFDELTFVAENGALVFDHDKVIFKSVMSEENLILSLNRIQTIDYATPILCGVDTAYMMQGGSKEALDNAKMYYKSLTFVEDLYQIAKTVEIVKIAIYFKQFKAAETYPILEDLSDEIKSVLSGESWIDIANKSSNKGNAIQAIQQKYQIRPEECMAFGDYLNDYELLSSCGESYAMENAHDEIKAICKYLTTTNDEDGVMRVLRKLDESK